MKRETTPANITDKIMELCSSAVPGAAPVYIPVETAGWGLMNECFPNVQQMVREYGGQQVNGWAVWQWANISVTLEAHAIWESLWILRPMTAVRGRSFSCVMIGWYILESR